MQAVPDAVGWILVCCCCRYAKTAGKDTRNSWLEFTKQYFLKRRVLVAVMLLVDGSIPPQRMDLDCANWLAEALVRRQSFCVGGSVCESSLGACRGWGRARCRRCMTLCATEWGTFKRQGSKVYGAAWSTSELGVLHCCGRAGSLFFKVMFGQQPRSGHWQHTWCSLSCICANTRLSHRCVQCISKGHMWWLARMPRRCPSASCSPSVMRARRAAPPLPPTSRPGSRSGCSSMRRCLHALRPALSWARGAVRCSTTWPHSGYWSRSKGESCNRQGAGNQV